MDVAEKLELLNTLFYVSIGVAVLGLVLAVLFFFLFRIPELFAINTGRARKKTLEQMRIQGASIGSIRQDGGVARTSKDYAASVVEMGGTTEEVARTDGGTAITQQLAAPAGPPGGGQPAETTLLNGETCETTVLSGPQAAPPPSPAPASAPDRGSRPDVRFDITEEIILIHTDEQIRYDRR